MFFAVPRVFEKMQEKFLSAISKKNVAVRKFIKWALATGKQGIKRQLQNKSKPYGYFLAENLVLKNIKAQLGMDEVEMRREG